MYGRISDCHVKLSLLLAALVALLLALTRDHFSQHDNPVAVHESNTRQALAILESIADKWLLWLEAALSHLVRDIKNLDLSIELASLAESGVFLVDHDITRT